VFANVPSAWDSPVPKYLGSEFSQTSTGLFALNPNPEALKVEFLSTCMMPSGESAIGSPLGVTIDIDTAS
jgi:hypothetical protein